MYTYSKGEMIVPATMTMWKLGLARYIILYAHNAASEVIW